jgi:hypothetical protein
MASTVVARKDIFQYLRNTIPVDVLQPARIGAMRNGSNPSLVITPTSLNLPARVSTSTLRLDSTRVPSRNRYISSNLKRFADC